MHSRIIFKVIWVFQNIFQQLINVETFICVSVGLSGETLGDGGVSDAISSNDATENSYSSLTRSGEE